MKNTRQTQTDHNEAGFSLVELAVVLIIIGVIVAGVLKGQDLIASAKLNGVQNQLNAIRVAVNTFQNKYGGLPGDLDPTSETMVPGFTTATNTADGTSVRNNGQIEGIRLSGTTGGTTVTEATLFWQHLRGANLLSGVILDTGGQGVTTTDDAPKSPLGGIFSISYDSALNGIAGNWLELGVAETAGTSNGNGLITPSRCMRSISSWMMGCPSPASSPAATASTTRPAPARPARDAGRLRPHQHGWLRRLFPAVKLGFAARVRPCPGRFFAGGIVHRPHRRRGLDGGGGQRRDGPVAGARMVQLSNTRLAAAGEALSLFVTRNKRLPCRQTAPFRTFPPPPARRLSPTGLPPPIAAPRSISASCPGGRSPWRRGWARWFRPSLHLSDAGWQHRPDAAGRHGHERHQPGGKR